MDPGPDETTSAASEEGRAGPGRCWEGSVFSRHARLPSFCSDQPCHLSSLSSLPFICRDVIQLDGLEPSCSPFSQPSRPARMPDVGRSENE